MPSGVPPPPVVLNVPQNRVASGGLEGSAQGGGGVGGSSSAQQDWSFIEGGAASPRTNARWKTPQSGYRQHPYRWKTTYKVTFYTDCPQNPIYFVYATTAYSFVSLNGQMIHSWGAPYPQYHNITLQKPFLKCGCNTIEVIVYNYCCPSPCGLTFSLSQDTHGCYDCDNTGVTYYNRETCQC